MRVCAYACMHVLLVTNNDVLAMWSIFLFNIDLILNTRLFEKKRKIAHEEAMRWKKSFLAFLKNRDLANNKWRVNYWY
jgi:hypothetical protein